MAVFMAHFKHFKGFHCRILLSSTGQEKQRAKCRNSPPDLPVSTVFAEVWNISPRDKAPRSNQAIYRRFAIVFSSSRQSFEAL